MWRDTFKPSLGKQHGDTTVVDHVWQEGGADTAHRSSSRPLHGGSQGPSMDSPASLSVWVFYPAQDRFDGKQAIDWIKRQTRFA